MKRSLVLLALVGTLIAAGTPMLHARDKRAHLDSSWRKAEIVVDGSPLDWPGALSPFNDQPVSVAAVNDGDSLFLVLTASERAVRTQILRQGLIVWFDPGGKDKKHFGVKFPVGGGFSAENYRGRRRGGGQSPAGDPAGTGDPQGADPQGPPADSTVDPPNRLEVLGASKDDVHSYTADKAPGIEVKVGQAEGLLTYELKVPLAANEAHPYAVGAKPGTAIGVGLEMPKLEIPQGRRGQGGGGGRMPGGGGGGGGMGGRGGRIGGMGGGGMGGRGGGGAPGGDRPAQAKPLNGWVTLQLAAGASK